VGKKAAPEGGMGGAGSAAQSAGMNTPTTPSLDTAPLGTYASDVVPFLDALERDTTIPAHLKNPLAFSMEWIVTLIDLARAQGAEIAALRHRLGTLEQKP